MGTPSHVYDGKDMTFLVGLPRWQLPGEVVESDDIRGAHGVGLGRPRWCSLAAYVEQAERRLHELCSCGLGMIDSVCGFRKG